jgi:hypothetical protein
MKPIIAFLAIATAASAAEMFPFQLPWDDASPSITNISWLNDKSMPPVIVKDGHLYAGEKRLRIFGVNVCFGANFPDKEMAPKVAARMAKFGINCVRFHHMDMFSAPSGIFAKDGRTLDAEQLDRLDWFIAKLKEHGIYANLNLHVSRTYPDRPKAEKKGNPDYDKGVDNYCAAMIALQRDYARDLLTHVNPYTGKSYAEEPAVALVEINNENALGFQWFAGEMDDLPTHYQEELESLWGAWISKKYSTDDAARKAWSEGARPAGAELYRSGGIPSAARWNFEQHGGAIQTHSEKDGVITVNVEKAGTESWHVQFNTSGIAIERTAYDVKLRVRAPKEISLSIALQESRDPWKALGSANVKVGTDWREITATVTPSAAEEAGRLSISGLGLTPGVFEFSDFSLRSAAVDGSLVRDEKGRVAMVKKRDLARTTTAKQRDWQEFIWDTETVYWNGMRDFLKKELGVRAPIVGTQGAWSPGHVQAGMDVIDSHAYWQHPDFKGRGWNQDEWTVKNIPMSGAKDGGTLPALAAQRVAGKPFICTEYNHSAPNIYAAETFPIICAFAALQDWDGVFAFSYSHRAGDAWSQEHFNNFFDIDRHPVKMATLPGAVLSFRRGDVAPINSLITWQITPKKARHEALKSGPSFAQNLSSNLADSAFHGQISSTYVPDDGSPYEWRLVTTVADVPGMPPQLLFFPKTRSAQLASKRSVFAIGAVGTTDAEGPGVVISGTGSWASYQLTAIGEAEIAKSKHILITATGAVENTDMRWKDAEKTSVGRNWGKAPVLVEGPSAKIALPGGGKFKAWALDERGQRRTEIPVAQATLEIGPQWKTLWYEVERQP